MRAAIFKGAGQPLAIEDRPDPEPAAGDVVIRIGRCGICGTDLHMTSGHNGFGLPVGSMLGHEYAGEVVALGRGVSRLKVGDRIAAIPVAGCGKCAACHTGQPTFCTEVRTMIAGFAEYVNVAEASAFRLPAALSMADGALVEPLAVGLHGVAMAPIGPGTRVLVLGAGSVGLAAIFWARQLGAGRIVAASPSGRRAELAAAMGADAFETLGEEAGTRIAAALGGPPDIVFECAGAVGLLGLSIDFVRPGGTVVSMGFCTAPDAILPSLATYKQVTIRFSLTYTGTEFQHCVDTLDRGHVEPRAMISETVSLDRFPAMLETLRTGVPHTKVQVDPWKTE